MLLRVDSASNFFFFFLRVFPSLNTCFFLFHFGFVLIFFFTFLNDLSNKERENKKVLVIEAIVNMRVNSFVLRAESQIHTADTKFVCAVDTSLIFSASRDSTVSACVLPENGDEFAANKTFIGHRAFVNFALYHPNLPLIDHEPCVITGSNDNHVIVWNNESCMIEAVLDGHSQGVSCGTILLNVPESSDFSWNGDILTGDWAGKCIIFDSNSGKPKQVYTKHEVAIRGLVQLPNSKFVVSVSGDKTAHIWSIFTAETVQICKFHEDVVQCVCAIRENIFATGSNDCTIAIWQTGIETPIRVLRGHTSLIYGISWNSFTSELLSCSEDRSVIVWGNQQNSVDIENFGVTQAVSLPTLVWSVSALPNGDFITGTSDGFIRVWTRNKSTQASREKIEGLNAAVASQHIDAKTTSADLLSSNIPSIHDIQNFHGSEGEKKIFKNDNGELELYIMGGGRWEKIGVVVSGPEQTPVSSSELPKEKHYFNGKEYDYLFDVEINGKYLKLPYNTGDSPIEAARTFITENSNVVSPSHFESIRDFIMDNISAESKKLLQQSFQTDISVIEPWMSFFEVSSFKAQGAQKRIDDFFNFADDFVGVMEKVKNGEDCSEKLLFLWNILPLGSRFPSLDAVRFLIRSKTLSNQRVCAIVNDMCQILKDANIEGEGELVVVLQFVSTVLEIAGHDSFSGLQTQLANNIQSIIAKSFTLALTQDNASTTLKKNIEIALRNSCVFIRKSLSSKTCSIGILDKIAEAVIKFSIPMAIREFLPAFSALITLYDSNALEGLPMQFFPQASYAGKNLIPTLQTIGKNCLNHEIRRVSVLILAQL